MKFKLCQSNRSSSLFQDLANRYAYNLLDLPQRQTTGEGTVVDYKYAFDGRKLQEKVTAGASVTQRDYSGEFLYEGGVLKKILFDGGYVINDVSGPVYMFFLRDHLGSVRAVVSETGAVQQMNNYFPYGDLFPNTSNDSSGNRYKYTGKESGDEIGLYDFSARFLHTRFGRFTTIDPLAEKYPDISPYAYCNGNPVNFVDPDGEIPVFVLPFLPVLAKAVAVTGGVAMTLWALNKMERSYSNSKYNPGYKHQEGQDRRNKRGLDQAQANIEKSIRDNYPDPDKYDPNENPDFRGGNKYAHALFLGLYLVGSNQDLIKRIFDNKSESSSKENNDNKTNEGGKEIRPSKKNTIIDTENDDVNNNIHPWILTK